MSESNDNCPVCGAKPMVVTTRTGLAKGYKIMCSNAVNNKCSYKGTSAYNTPHSAFYSWNAWAKESVDAV